jgi:hypothetical protein
LELKLNYQNQINPFIAGSLAIDLELVQKLEDLYYLHVYMYALSSFWMKNKQYYVDGLKEHLTFQFLHSTTSKVHYSSKLAIS